MTSRSAISKLKLSQIFSRTLKVMLWNYFTQNELDKSIRSFWDTKNSAFECCITALTRHRKYLFCNEMIWCSSFAFYTRLKSKNMKRRLCSIVLPEIKFLTLPTALVLLLETSRHYLSKIALIFQCGYFRACHRFFGSQFRVNAASGK